MGLFFLVVCRVVIEVPSLSGLLQLALRRLPRARIPVQGHVARSPCLAALPLSWGPGRVVVFSLLECHLGGRESRVPSLLDLLLRACRGPTEGLPGIWWGGLGGDGLITENRICYQPKIGGSRCDLAMWAWWPRGRPPSPPVIVGGTNRGWWSSGHRWCAWLVGQPVGVGEPGQWWG